VLAAHASKVVPPAAILVNFIAVPLEAAYSPVAAIQAEHVVVPVRPIHLSIPR